MWYNKNVEENKVKVTKQVKEKLKINTEIEKIIISKGLVSHMKKSRHEKMIKYISEIENIINNPDYIGINPREKGTSLEYLKVFDDNVLLAVKLDIKRNYFYTASMYDVTEAKLQSMLSSGRIKKY